jgi:hypothetical protein
LGSDRRKLTTKPSIVMPGRVPGIDALIHVSPQKAVDGRDTPSHDGRSVNSA